MPPSSQQPQQQQPQQISKEHHNYRHRHRPKSKDFDKSKESLDQLQDTNDSISHQQQQQRARSNHHTKFNMVGSGGDDIMMNDERDDTEDNLADEELKDDEAAQVATRQKDDTGGDQRDKILNHDCDDNKITSEGCGSCENRIEANVINDELKYGAGHTQSMDSNPLESQSEWSDDDCREEATGKKCFSSLFVCMIMA